MKKNSLLLFLAFSLYSSMQAQFLQNYTGDNYSGINGALMQPASIVDSRYLFDINFIGWQAATSSNYIAYNMNFLSNIDLASPNSTFKYYRDSKLKSYHYQNQDLQYLSFMISITPKDAVGFTKRTRTFSNADGLDQDMALLLFSGFSNASLTNQLITNKKLSYQKMKYKETAFTYSRVISDDKENFIKAGVTLKVLNGVEALSLYSKDVQLTPGNGGNVQFSNTEFSYGYSQNTSAGFNNKIAFGLDLGVVYEFRPDHKTFFYEMDGKKGLVRKDLNKYKFKIGASLLDIGRIKFTKTDNSTDFVINQSVSGIQAVDKGNMAAINTFINGNNFQALGGNKSTFKMNLPTALSIQGDYFFMKNLYVGYTSYIPIWLRIDKSKIHNLMTHVIAPRYETKHMCVSLPISLMRNGQVNAGLNLRLGSFTVGTTNLSSYLIGKRRLYDANFYASFRSYFLYPAPQDKDGDKTSDKKDFCPTEPGPYNLQGCPDTDQDGLADYKDYCPNVAGPITLNGCPDTDGDGILDYQDACPTEKGFVINKGCPDRDKDGILDVADRCPDVPGIKENNGCPEEPILCCADSDGDGILDKFDDCPETFGPLVNKGCPTGASPTAPQNQQLKPDEEKQLKNTDSPDKKNKDKSGKTGQEEATKVPEKTDGKSGNTGKLPEKANTSSEKEGVTKDGVPIKNSSSTDTLKSTATAKGKVNKKAGKTIKDTTTFLMDDPEAIVYFDKDSYKLLPKYYNDLNKIVKDMQKKKTAKLLIQGHTDNDGDDEYNIDLSYKRTLAVQAYIIKKGRGAIDSKRVEILYFGEKQPLLNNTDEKKKQVNRRVELKIIP